MKLASKHSPQQQETLVLDAAAKCIEKTSLLDFKMIAIAKEAGLSMGSIYKHIQSKEDVLVALATRVARQHHRAFTEIMALPLTMPERLMGCVLITPEKLHSLSFGVYLEMLTANEAVVQRASNRWIENYSRIAQTIDAVFSDAVTKSWSEGELMVGEKDRDWTIDMILIALWSMSVGFTQVAYQSHSWNLAGTDSDLPFPLAPEHAVVESAKRLINTVPWKTPLDEKGIDKACAMLEERGYR